MLLYAVTIFVGAFLLFQAQPVIAKIILPWFGGSAAVWTTCLLFFQLVLVLGYLYAHALTHWLRPRAQAVTHCALLLASALALPIYPGAGWKPVDAGRSDPENPRRARGDGGDAVLHALDYGAAAAGMVCAAIPRGDALPSVCALQRGLDVCAAELPDSYSSRCWRRASRRRCGSLAYGAFILLCGFIGVSRTQRGGGTFAATERPSSLLGCWF